MATRKKPDFERNLTELENLVESLEAGGLSLEESLKTFEKGILITRQCQEALTEAEQKVSLLTQDKNGELSEQSFTSTTNAEN